MYRERNKHFGLGTFRFNWTNRYKLLYIYIYIVREREIKTNSEREERVTDISGWTCLDRICDCSLQDLRQLSIKLDRQRQNWRRDRERVREREREMQRVKQTFRVGHVSKNLRLLSVELHRQRQNWRERERERGRGKKTFRVGHVSIKFAIALYTFLQNLRLLFIGFATALD